MESMRGCQRARKRALKEMNMRKALMDASDICSAGRTSEEWLELERMTKVETTSEDPKFPIESALSLRKGSGWRAATIGIQVIRLIFDERKDLGRIKLVFSEAETERTQQFTLRWARDPNGPSREIVRQQWNFSPHGSTCEVEDYSVDGRGVGVARDTGPRCGPRVRDTKHSARRRITQFSRHDLNQTCYRFAGHVTTGNSDMGTGGILAALRRPSGSSRVIDPALSVVNS